MSANDFYSSGNQGEYTPQGGNNNNNSQDNRGSGGNNGEQQDRGFLGGVAGSGIARRSRLLI